MFTLPFNTKRLRPSRATASSALTEMNAVADKLDTVGFERDAETIRNLAGLVDTCFEVHDTMTLHFAHRMIAEHEEQVATSRITHVVLGTIMTLAAAVLGFLIGRSI